MKNILVKGAIVAGIAVAVAGVGVVTRRYVEDMFVPPAAKEGEGETEGEKEKKKRY